MTGFEVNTAMLFRAAEQVTAASEQGLATDVAAVLANVPGAMKGGQTEMVAPVTADVLRGALRNWAATAEAHGYKLNTSAEEYQAHDDAVVRVFSWEVL
jgi:hypothetical protein